MQSLIPQSRASFIGFMLKCNIQSFQPNRNQIVKNKSQQNQISPIFGPNCAALKPSWARAHVALKLRWKGAPSLLQTPVLPFSERKTLKWRHTWSDINLAQPEQFPDSSLTSATGAAVTLGGSVTTCSGINAASHVDVSQRIHVNGALVGPALCLELSSCGIFIKERKRLQNRNIMRTHQDSPCLQLTGVCKLVVM